MKKVTILFIALGILFGTISVCLAFLPVNTKQLNDQYNSDDNLHEYHKITTNKYFDNASLGTLATALISATCFLIAGNLIKNEK